MEREGLGAFLRLGVPTELDLEPREGWLIPEEGSPDLDVADRDVLVTYELDREEEDFEGEVELIVPV
jgi:hypothetical protein